MSWTDQEADRITAIEEAINQLYVVINNLAAKKQQSQLMVLIEGQFTTLTARVTALENSLQVLQNQIP